jgi:hypothetical protein
MWTLIVHAELDWYFGPFNSKSEAESHAAMYCQDFRCDIVRYDPKHSNDLKTKPLTR